jgi:hypothetical protein
LRNPQSRGNEKSSRVPSVFAGVVFTCSLLAGVTSASAAGLVPCVQSPLAWSDSNSEHYVGYAAVALHETAQGAYFTGVLKSSNCPRELWAGTIRCLVPTSVHDALLLRPEVPFWPWTQLKADDFLRIAVNSIPAENEQEVHLSRSGATYDFYAQCVGKLLTGNDQYGNHWTIAFRELDYTLR